MQLRLTVLGPQSGTAPAIDVTVGAPDGTVLAAVLGGLAEAAAPGSGAPGTVYCGSERLDPRQHVLGRAPLVDGAVLAFQHPVDTAGLTAPDDSWPRILVLSGPDAGGVHLLHQGEIRIGRSADADVPIDDPDVSRLHCVLGVTPDGTLTVRDAGSTNGTALEGRLVGTEDERVPHGAELRIGESVLRLLAGTGPPRQAPDAASDGDAPSDGDAASDTGWETAHDAASEASDGTPPDAERRGARGRRRGGAERGGSRGGRVQHGIPALPPAAERAALPPSGGAVQAERWPDPPTVLLTALSAGERLWERSGGHRDAFTVRLGTAQRPSGPLLPVTVNLAAIGSLGLTGPWPRLAALARSVLVQLATLHHPEALEIVVVAPGRAAEWSWLGWLPHTRPTRGQDCHRLLAFDQEQATARLAELTSRLTPAAGGTATAAPAGPSGPDGTAGRRTVVLVDGEPDAPRTRDQLARLAAAGSDAGIDLLVLAPAPPATPASPLTATVARAERRLPVFGACGMVGVLAGEVATAVRLLLPNGEPGPPATIDGVSGPLAERLARALAPRPRVGGGAGTARASGDARAVTLPDTARLLDALGLPRVTPGALRERWARADGGLPVVLGTGASGASGVDLVEAPGPLLIDGPTRSGRTELLCAVAASLAVARAPRHLSLLLIDGADEGLLPCADLPHVAERLRTTDALRMRAFAQALRGELNRRAALLGEYDFDHWTAAGRTDREPRDRPTAPQRVVSQRGSGDEAPAPPWPDGGAPGRPLRRLVVLADDVAALRSPALGAPGRPAAGSVVRALEAVVREGPRLGVHLVAAAEPAEWEVAVRVALGGRPAGRAELALPDGVREPFQAGRVTGRIPRTATMRPTVTPIDWARVGDPPKRRPVRELGNGPTDMALLASAATRADQPNAARAPSPA